MRFLKLMSFCLLSALAGGSAFGETIEATNSVSCVRSRRQSQEVRVPGRPTAIPDSVLSIRINPDVGGLGTRNVLVLDDKGPKVIERGCTEYPAEQVLRCRLSDDGPELQIPLTSAGALNLILPGIRLACSVI